MGVPTRCRIAAVIGNGIIGHGIAQIFAMAGRDVILIGRSSTSLAQAKDRIGKSLADFQSHELITAADADAAHARIKTSTDLGDAAPADFVIEAVTEDLGLKRRIFGDLNGICPPPAVLASSSGQPASALVEKVGHRDRVIATHFWYPPQLIPLVEVCGGPETSPDVVKWTCNILREIGKEPALIDQEISGFIGNRLQFAMLREAWSLWARGIASAEAIDTVVRTSFGRRLGVTGPLASADIAGLHTMYHFGKSLMPDLDTSPVPHGRIAELVEGGANGFANGRGVYDWSRHDGHALVAERMRELFRWLKQDRNKGPIDDRRQ
jgi:3-hydroxybutyryl-CoA dehydrogenase